MIEKPNMTAYERLQNPLNTFRGSKYCFSARHMPYLLKKLRSMYGVGPYAFGYSIDAGNAELIRTHIQRNYQDFQVNAAHEACVLDYQINNPRSSSKPRMNMSTGQIEDSRDVESAIFGDTSRDQAWLDEQVNNTTDTAMGAALQKAIEKKDNAQSIAKSDMDNYVTKPELNEAMNRQQRFMADGITRLKTAIVTDIKSLEDATHTVTTMLANEIQAIKDNKPTIIEIQKPDLPETVKLGLQHKHFPLLLATVQSRLRNGNRVIPWVYGPAGTGKSFAAESLAKALNLKPYVMGTTLTKFEVTGFINTTGYQTTAFREAYEHGGAFCADEMDSWTKEATVALNNGLANSHFTFPDKTVARHPDFVMVACANTVGTGANLDYVGRNKLDGATLNRFAYIHWPLDEGLEDGICANKEWLQYVRCVRANVARSNLNPKPLITPRASIFGETLLNSGIDWATVVEMCLRQGLSDAQWNGIK